MMPPLERAALLFTAIAGAACGNPVTDDAIEAWGGELPNVAPGEHHRPGQPCVLCHSVAGGASPKLLLGGTIFSDQTSFLPVEGAEVVIYDAVGDSYTMKSNCIGNFYLEEGDKSPQFPLAAEIRCPTFSAAGEPLEAQKVVSMNSWISRDGSCATCHALTGTGPSSTGWLFCNSPDEIASNPYPPVADSCPGEPPATAGGDGDGNGDGSGNGMGAASQ